MLDKINIDQIPLCFLVQTKMCISINNFAISVYSL